REKRRRWMPALRDGLDQRLGRGAIDVDERDPCALRAEVLDDRRADAAATAGDERHASVETWVRGGLDHETLQAMDLITLRADGAGLTLAPAAGGSVARYRIDRGHASWDLLRSSAASRPTDPFECAAFALVPYSNRIRAGRFSFGRRDVRLPLNRPPERHSIHGLGWSMAWRPLDVREREATMEFRHDAGSWPWAFRAIQH